MHVCVCMTWLLSSALPGTGSLNKLSYCSYQKIYYLTVYLMVECLRLRLINFKHRLDYFHHAYLLGLANPYHIVYCLFSNNLLRYTLLFRANKKWVWVNSQCGHLIIWTWIIMVCLSLCYFANTVQIEPIQFEDA